MLQPLQRALILLMIMCAGFSVSLKAQDTIRLDNNTSTVCVGLHSYYFRDSSEAIGIDTIQQLFSRGRFKKSDRIAPIFGIASASFWYRFTVINSIQRQWYFTLDKSRQDTLEIYCEVDGNTFLLNREGENFPYSVKKIPISHPMFELFTPVNKPVTYYVRFSGRETSEFPMWINSPNAVIQKNHYLDILDGAYIGFIVLIFLYNLLIYFSTRDRIYLYYILYVLSVGCVILQFKGLGFEFVWRMFPGYNSYPTVFPAFSVLFGALFTMRFLDTKKQLPRAHRAFNIFFFGAALCVTLNLLGHVRIAQNIVQGNSFAAAVFMLILGIQIYRKGYSPAKFYLLSWSFFLICVIIYLLKDITVLPYTPFTSNAIQIGSAFEVVLLSLALGDRINTYRKEKQDALLENEQLIREQNKILEQKVDERTQQLTESLDSLNVQKKIVEEQNKDILDSIHYAKRIQAAILPPVSAISEALPDSFICYQPKDIVSGDFYWFHELDEDRILLAAADCTGHGVPGAFMTVIADTSLNQVVNEFEITSPAGILQAVEYLMQQTWKKDGIDESIYDGMDIALALIDRKNKVITFSGAMRPLIICSEDGIDELPANRFGIGGSDREKKFEERTIKTEPGMTFYMFTDGYLDQFGGKNNKKFGKKRFLELVQSVQHMKKEEQHAAFTSTITEWKEGYIQTDDILVIGFRI